MDITILFCKFVVMKLTNEFIDYFNLYDKNHKSVSELPICVLTDMKERIEKLIKTSSIKELEDYLIKASATSDTEVQCVLISMIDNIENDGTNTKSKIIRDKRWSNIVSEIRDLSISKIN